MNANDVDFALVLYTPCDHGGGVHEPKVAPRSRARQNVVFEHGYLMAKLGRENVCALVKGEIETPNDLTYELIVQAMLYKLGLQVIERGEITLVAHDV